MKQLLVRGLPALARRRRLVFLLAAFTLATACEDITAPPQTEREFSSGPSFHAAPPGWSNRFPIPIPPQNHPNQGAVDTARMVAPDSTWVRMRVDGGVSLMVNSTYQQICTTRGTCGDKLGFSGTTVGPDGAVVSGQHMRSLAVWAEINYNGRLITFASDGTPSQYVYAWIGRGEKLYRRRTGIPGGETCLSGMTFCTPGQYYPSFEMTGAQEVNVERVHAPIHISAPSYVLSTNTATFTATQDVPLSGVMWYFVPGDTLATPRNPNTLSDTYRVWECALGSMVCRYKPPRSGRMYVTGGAYGAWSARDISEVVWVDRATVECPDAVVRGSALSCTFLGAQAATITRWEFAAGSITVVDSSGIREWTGPAVIGGTVTVTYNVNGGVPQVLVDSFRVTRRPWGQLSLSVRNIGNDNLTTPPTIMSDLANTDIRNPVTYPLQQVPSGPNTGLWYLSTAPAAVDVIVRWNDAWRVTHPWYLMQTGGSHPSGGGALWCDQSDLPGIRQRAEEHEGLSSGPNDSHISVLQSYFAAFSQPATADTTSPQAKLEQVVIQASAQPDSLMNVNYYEAVVRSAALTDPKQNHYDPTTGSPSANAMVPLVVNLCYLRY